MLKIHVVPWSPPGWLKTTGTMNGGSLTSSAVSGCESTDSLSSDPENE